jgi:putative hydrolase of the HAD superfamily
MSRRYEAVLLDAFGTLIDVDRPAERLQAAVRVRLGLEVDLDAAGAAFVAEAGYYADHCHLAVDAATLADLYRRCAAIVLDRLDIDHDPQSAVDLLADAIAFTAYPDAPPALAGLRAAGVHVAVVSNADYTLPAMLAQAGIEIEHVFDSASCGSSKPDPGIFHRALATLGVDPRAALHVGDTPEADGDGARAAGVEVRIIDRTGAHPGSIASLTELLDLVGAPA